MLFAPSTPFLYYFSLLLLHLLLLHHLLLLQVYASLSYPTLPCPALSHPTLPYPIPACMSLTAQHSTAPPSLTSLLNQRWKIFNFYFARSTWRWSCALHCLAVNYTVLHYTVLRCQALHGMAGHCIDHLERQWSAVDKDTTLPSPMK